MKPTRVPWNKGKLVGAKPPLRPSQIRDEVMATTIADVRGLSEAAAEIARRAPVMVIGSSASIEAVNAELPEPLAISKLL